MGRWRHSWLARTRTAPAALRVGAAAARLRRVPFRVMHEDLGAHAGQDPDPTERAYRVAVLLDGVSEVSASS